MQLRAERHGDMLLVRVDAARITAAVAVRFKDQMRAAVDCPARRVVLDLSRVGFVDSSGLGAVLSVVKMLAPARRLELAGLAPEVEEVFRLTKLDRVLTIHAELPGGPGESRRQAG